MADAFEPLMSHSAMYAICFRSARVVSGRPLRKALLPSKRESTTICISFWKSSSRKRLLRFQEGELEPSCLGLTYHVLLE